MVMQIIFPHYGNENLEITVLKCHENNVTIQKKKRKLLVTSFDFAVKCEALDCTLNMQQNVITSLSNAG